MQTRTVLSAVFAFVAAPALAQDGLLGGALHSGWQTEHGTHMAGVEIRLAPGWKTYWRAPGDAGIPPQFDWAGSENVGSVRIHWPAPEVIDQNGLTTIGYHGDVVLPVEITPRDPSRPVHLRAHVAFGVCSDICVPAEMRLEAPLLPPGHADGALKAALANRPHTPGERSLTDLTCTVEPIRDGLRLRAAMRLPPQGPGHEVVVVEPSEPGVWVSGAVVTRENGWLLAETEMVGPSGAPFALSRAGLTVTVIGPKGAVEAKGCPAP
jgi:hypothetical protein